MWLELEPIQHYCHAQLAAVRQNSSGNALMPCFCFARQSHVLSWNLGATSLLVAVPRLGGLGHQNFCPGFFCRQGGCAHSLRCSRRPAMSCRSPHELRLTDSHSVGSDPVSTLPEHVPKGAACQCWLGTWHLDPCHGDAPRSNDPLRCGLNSSPSNITAMRNLPQFAEIPQGMH